MKHVLFVLVTLFCLLMAGCAPREVRYVVGVSQCSDDEWREQMNKEIRREALLRLISVQRKIIMLSK